MNFLIYPNKDDIMRHFIVFCLVLACTLLFGNTAKTQSPSSADYAAFANAFETPLPDTAGTHAQASGYAYFSDSGDEIGVYSVLANIRGPHPWHGRQAFSGKFKGSLSRSASTSMDITEGPDAIHTQGAANVDVDGVGDDDDAEA